MINLNSFNRIANNYSGSNCQTKKAGCSSFNAKQALSGDLVSFTDNNSDNNDLIVPGNTTEGLMHHTIFFRDAKIIGFLKDYLVKNFPKGTTILDYGCSSGEESRSIAMFIANKNKDKKYKIIGYDPDPESIEQARNGFYHINVRYDGYERFESFKKFFQKYATIRLYTIPEIDGNDNAAELKFDDSLFEDILSFKIGNIAEIDKEVEKEKFVEKPGVVVFKNAWHYLHTSYYKDEEGYTDSKYEIDNLKKTLNKIANVLPDNGILVVGTLASDHMLTLGTGLEERGEIEDTPFHNALRECGFEPIQKYYDHCEEDTGNPKVPAIWKKVKKPEKTST